MNAKRIATPSVTLTRKALSDRVGVGAETLRFYETTGLLRKPKRSAAGYRLYTEEDVTRLDFIRRSQELGFSLQDIKLLLELTGDIKTPRNKVKNFAEARLSIIRGKIRDLRAMEKNLSALVKDCDGRGALKGCPIVDFIGGNASKKGACHE